MNEAVNDVAPSYTGVLCLTVESAPPSDVAGLEVGQQRPSSRDTSQLYLVAQSHRLGQLDKCNIIAKRQRWEVAERHDSIIHPEPERRKVVPQ